MHCILTDNTVLYSTICVPSPKPSILHPIVLIGPYPMHTYATMSMGTTNLRRRNAACCPKLGAIHICSSFIGWHSWANKRSINLKAAYYITDYRLINNATPQSSLQFANIASYVCSKLASTTMFASLSTRNIVSAFVVSWRVPRYYKGRDNISCIIYVRLCGIVGPSVYHLRRTKPLVLWQKVSALKWAHSAAGSLFTVKGSGRRIKSSQLAC